MEISATTITPAMQTWLQDRICSGGATMAGLFDGGRLTYVDADDAPVIVWNLPDPALTAQSGGWCALNVAEMDTAQSAAGGNAVAAWLGASDTEHTTCIIFTFAAPVAITALVDVEVESCAFQIPLAAV
jgi:hypothetical protein